MKNIIEDERTVSAKRNIQSDTLQILIFALLAAVFVQKIFLNAPVSQYIVEFVAALGASVYILIRTIYMGIDEMGTRVTTAKSLITTALLLGLVAMICFAFITGITDVGSILIFFLCYTVALLALRFAIKYFTGKRQQEMDDILDNDE